MNYTRHQRHSHLRPSSTSPLDRVLRASCLFPRFSLPTQHSEILRIEAACRCLTAARVHAGERSWEPCARRKRRSPVLVSFDSHCLTWSRGFELPHDPTRRVGTQAGCWEGAVSWASRTGILVRCLSLAVRQLLLINDKLPPPVIPVHDVHPRRVNVRLLPFVVDANDPHWTRGYPLFSSIKGEAVSLGC